MRLPKREEDKIPQNLGQGGGAKESSFTLGGRGTKGDLSSFFFTLGSNLTLRYTHP